MIRRNTILGGCLALLVAVPGFAETLTFEGDRLTVRNVIGKITVEGSRGSDFEVEVEMRGADARSKRIEIDANETELNLVFPNGVREYVYPDLDRDSVNLKRSNGNRISDLFGADRIKVRSSGSGTELWADVTIRMPAGTRLKVEHGVGVIVGSGLRGEIELSTRTGDVKLSDADGDISVATGSGNVEVFRLSGDGAAIATGSGNVEGQGFDGDKLRVATGSGDVFFHDVRGASVQFATGSGDVEAKQLDVEDMSVGTGSGDVVLAVDRLADGEVSVGTGSGDIRVTLPSGVSADVHAETDGGRISVDLGAGVEYRVKEDDEVELTVGGGDARIRLGSGNGNIRIAN